MYPVSFVLSFPENPLLATLDGLHVPISEGQYPTMIGVVRDKFVVSNAQIRAGRDGALILWKSYGTKGDCRS